MGQETIVEPAKPGLYHPFIDGLRAVAVLGVICYHYGLLHLPGGFVGVDVFFVLSGFLITQLIDSRLAVQAFSFAHFYERRARRILPALLLTCLLSALAAFALLVPHDLREFAKSLKGTAFFFSNLVFAEATGYFADAVSARPLLHTWSLAVEEQFYLLFPPLLWGVHRLLAGRPRARFWLIGVLAAASFGAAIVWMQKNPVGAFYLLPPRAWELLLGGSIALWGGRIEWPRALAELLALLGLAAILLACVLYGRDTPFPGITALPPCLGTALLILANVGNRTLIGRLLALRPLIYLGLISYGLYLYHWPVLAFTRYYLDHELSLQQTLAALGLTTTLAVLSYHLLESPIRSSRMLKQRRVVFTASAAGLIFIGALGVAGVNADGFPQRLSGDALGYASANHDRWDWNRCMPALDELSRQTACRFGADGMPPSFLVWGDSHAAALAPGVDARARTLGIAGWIIGYSRCPSLLDAAPIQHAVDDHPCAAIAAKTMDLIRDSGIRHVLLVTRWDTYISGWERGGTETMQDLTIAYEGPDGARAVGLPAFRLALADTVRRLHSMGVDVWILKQVPPQLVDVPSALAKAVYFHHDPNRLRRPVAEIEARRAPAEGVFDSYSVLADVSFIDPMEKLCPNGTACLIAADGHALYSDGNHLSVFGARWSQEMLDPFFSSTIRSASRP